MPRTPAKVRQADIARAIRAAESCGKVVRILPDGTIEFADKAAPAAAETTPPQPLEARRSIRL